MTWKRKANPERNVQIYEDYKAGAKYKEMSDFYQLSIQRIQQIIKRERNRRLKNTLFSKFETEMYKRSNAVKERLNESTISLSN